MTYSGKRRDTMATQSANGLLAVWTDIAPEVEREFNDWYNTEHIPQLLGVPGFLSGRRYLAVEGEPKYLALYDLNDARIPKSPEWDRARNSEWTLRIRPHLKDGKVIISRCIFP